MYQLTIKCYIQAYYIIEFGCSWRGKSFCWMKGPYNMTHHLCCAAWLALSQCVCKEQHFFWMWPITQRYFIFFLNTHNFIFCLHHANKQGIQNLADLMPAHTTWRLMLATNFFSLFWALTILLLRVCEFQRLWRIAKGCWLRGKTYGVKFGGW